MFTWSTLLSEIFDVVEEMANDAQLAPAQKLDALTVELTHVIEALDDVAVSLLPPGIASLAKFLIDNPAMDDLQKTSMVRPVAEMFYQFWKAKQAWLGK